MKKRILTVALVVALLATCFGGTLAYLKDSEAQTNTFTTGNVLISLDEAVVEKNAEGNLVAKGEERTEDEQSYHLFPAMTVTKDPTITVDTASENAWIAAKITFAGYNAYALLSGGEMFDTDTEDVEVVQNGNVVYVYAKAIQAAGTELVLFDTLTVPTDWDNTEMALINNMTITVEAYGVQANGFADCKTAMKTAFPNAFPAN